MQPTHCRPTRQHRWWDRRTPPDELPNPGEIRGGLQPDAKAPGARLSERRTDPFWTDSVSQIDSLLAGSAVCIRGQIDPGRYRRAWPAALSRTGCANGERAHRERGRDGSRVRGGKQAGNNRRHQNARSATQRGAFKVGHGYILGLPVAAYLTWQGRMLENDGISPPVPTELSREALREGRDTQLETAIEAIKAL